jgi:hypothetical protein
VKALPKSFAASLLIFIMVLQISTPAFAQSTALSQAKEIQACFESVIGKSLSPENLLKVDLGEHKYIDRLAATKAMMIWSLGDFTNQPSILLHFQALRAGPGLRSLTGLRNTKNNALLFRQRKLRSIEQSGSFLRLSQ